MATTYPWVGMSGMVWSGIHGSTITPSMLMETRSGTVGTMPKIISQISLPMTLWPFFEGQSSANRTGPSWWCSPIPDRMAQKIRRPSTKISSSMSQRTSKFEFVCTYRVSHSKVSKVILLCWGHRFLFLLIFWVLHVHQIASFMPNSSILIFLMLCGLYWMISRSD